MRENQSNRELRCGVCHRLLAKGEAIELAIKCPRCGAMNHLRAMSPSPAGHEPRNGASHDPHLRR
ncbi:Com family DNA-binding transcriptional regulator [Nitratidesulfovibrio vulgaris]|uniref:Com family DNA-binding transcriptional regulator n=1 Tax=Nitratidesulfovibrio vulgaris TaxID=881 RepID=UPI0001ECFF3C|nr:Com family DNA-binding transcriptional regulator [Nitratidesulfovibrio vulgaris]ADP86180.1 hypothetical protein Deval_1016 [Nitratidesulfovibrio vulgaris RCH1]